MVFANLSFANLRYMRAFLVRVIGNKNSGCRSKTDYIQYLTHLLRNDMDLIPSLFVIFDWIISKGFKPTMKTKMSDFKAYFNYTLNGDIVTLSVPKPTSGRSRCVFNVNVLEDLKIMDREDHATMEVIVVPDDDDDYGSIRSFESIHNDLLSLENIYDDYGPQQPVIEKPSPNHLKDFMDISTTVSEIQCEVCCDHKKCVAITKCGHVFCRSCTLKCDGCPTCRVKYTPTDLLRVFI